MYNPQTTPFKSGMFFKTKVHQKEIFFSFDWCRAQWDFLKIALNPNLSKRAHDDK